MKRVAPIVVFAVLFASSPIEAAAKQDGFYPPLPNVTGTRQVLVVDTVSLPIDTVDVSVTNFTEPVTTSNINASDNLIGFQGDLTFDSSVVTFQTPPVSAAGVTASGWTVSAMVLSGGGPIRTLHLSAFSNDGVTPLSGSGTLFNLNMIRVGSPGENTPLTWAASPSDFEFIDTDLNSQSPSSAPSGSITTGGGSSGGVNISGTIYYCTNPNSAAIPGVTVQLSFGSITVSDGNGHYEVHGPINLSGNDVIPSKANLVPGAMGVGTADVIATQRHFLAIALLAGCRLTAADANGDNAVNTTDVISIQRFFLGLTNGTANVGQYRFIPSSRHYNGNVTLTNQDFSGLVFGDVTAPFVH